MSEEREGGNGSRCRQRQARLGQIGIHSFIFTALARRWTVRWRERGARERERESGAAAPGGGGKKLGAWLFALSVHS